MLTFYKYCVLVELSLEWPWVYLQYPGELTDGGEENHLEMVFSSGGGNMMSENEIASKFPIHRKIKTSEMSAGYSDLFKNIFVMEKKTPTPGTCFTWAGYHYKTFDGRVIRYKNTLILKYYKLVERY